MVGYYGGFRNIELRALKFGFLLDGAGVGCLAYSSLLYVVVEHHAEILGGCVHGLFEVPFCYLM